MRPPHASDGPRVAGAARRRLVRGRGCRPGPMRSARLRLAKGQLRAEAAGEPGAHRHAGRGHRRPRHDRGAAAAQPHISVLVDPCYGGVIASYASVADIIIAEPGANIGFAGRRVIEQTIRQKLPANFQTAEFLLEHGMIDMVVPRSDLRATLARLLRLYIANTNSAAQAIDEPMMMHV